MRVNSVSFGQTSFNTGLNMPAVKATNSFMTKPAKDEFVKATNVQNNNLQMENAVRKFNEINDKNSEKGLFGKKRFGLAETRNFKALYKEDKIDVPTVEKFASNTALDVKSLSNIYTTGKSLKDDNFSDKVLNAANEINKTSGNKVVKFDADEKNQEFALTFKNKADKTSADVNKNVYDAKTGALSKEIKERYFVKDLENTNGNMKAGNAPVFMYADRMMTKETNDLKNNTKTTQTFKFDNLAQEYKLEQEVIEKAEK